MAGLLDQGWMTPDRAIAFQGIGAGLSQLAAGQPVNMAPALEALQQRQQSAQMRKVMDVPGIMDRFTPQQRAVLAAMPESLATKIITENAFAGPPEPVKGIAVDGKLVNPITGEVMYGGTPDAPTAGYIASGDTAASLGLDPSMSYNITSGPNGMKADVIGPVSQSPEKPLTQKITLPDGSEALVQWNDKTNVWDAAKIPEGGTGAQPRGKLTEMQARTTLFETIQNETSPVLSDIEKKWDPANIKDAAARMVPVAGNFFQSSEGQVYNAAATAWSEGALRIATGQAAAAGEVDRIVKVYFAQPGDMPATVAFKSQLREMYDRAIKASLGKDPGKKKLITPIEFASTVAPAVGNGSPETSMSRDEALKLLMGN